LKKNTKKLSKREATFIIVVLVIIGASGLYALRLQARSIEKLKAIDTFEECAAAGNPIMESYPEQCAANGRSFSNPNQKVEPSTN